MREIKFRGWERDLKVMVYGDELCGHTEYSCNPVKAVNIILNENDDGYVYMQYTGMKDKNGREIYEGDIVEYKHIVTNSPVVREVIFKSGQWMVCCREPKAIDILREDFSGIRVIGNIYEGWMHECIVKRGDVIGDL